MTIPFRGSDTPGESGVQVTCTREYKEGGTQKNGYMLHFYFSLPTDVL